MTEHKELGKIKSVSFCQGGYNEGMIGVQFDLHLSGGGGVGDFWGDWHLKQTEHCKWTEESRLTRLGQTVMRINKLLNDAKVRRLEDLAGKPIEVFLDGNLLVNWRILTEVI